jgi:hypothetical protein
MIRGQINLRQAVDRSISFHTPEGKCYELNEKTATLIVRPRGWHLLERHMLVDGDPVSGVALRLRPLLLPQRREAGGERQRPVLLPAEDREPPERASGTTCSTRPRAA